MVDADRLLAAFDTAHCDLLAECNSAGHWIGQLASSPLSTATAISALTLFERHAPTDARGCFADESRESRVSELLVSSVHWLARRQNPDGGWGDTDKSLSNIATTMLVRAAFQLTGVPAEYEYLLEAADAYIARSGGVHGLRRRYGRDKTFAAPILANLALAELIPWRNVPALPFELAALPERFWRRLRMPVVSYAIPALVAIGQVKFHYSPPWNPVSRAIRGRVSAQTLEILSAKQPSTGGYLEAIPLTSFVVMSLAGMGEARHPVAIRGAQFLLGSVRPDGSWPIDVNLATWNTTLAINALATSGEDVSQLGCLAWLLGCQGQTTHPFTGADPGAWAWTDLPGGVPDADDTSGALLALDHWRRGLSQRGARVGGECLDRSLSTNGARPSQAAVSDPVEQPVAAEGSAFAEVGARPAVAGDSSPNHSTSGCAEAGAAPGEERTIGDGASGLAAIVGDTFADKTNVLNGLTDELQIVAAGRRGVEWLANLQNRDGGWPTFCRGWGSLPFDRSGADLTAHALRALGAWRDTPPTDVTHPGDEGSAWKTRLRVAVDRGFDYLQGAQRPDGSWAPLWFGNQHQADESNPVYGTSKVILAYSELGRLAAPAAVAGLDWLVKAQNADGGWGGSPPEPAPPRKKTTTSTPALPRRRDGGQQNAAPPGGVTPSVRAFFRRLKSSPQAPASSTLSANVKTPRGSSVEETGVAVEALLSALAHGGQWLAADKEIRTAADRGVNWLIDAVEANGHNEASPIGFYFAKLWYYERLYPLIFTVAALGHAVRGLLPSASTARTSTKPTVAGSVVGNR